MTRRRILLGLLVGLSLLSLSGCKKDVPEPPPSSRASRPFMKPQ